MVVLSVHLNFLLLPQNVWLVIVFMNVCNDISCYSQLAAMKEALAKAKEEQERMEREEEEKIKRQEEALRIREEEVT